jgi:hypothetical protein
VKPKDPYQQEHDDLIGAIIANNDYNEAERAAYSTMSVIMGRMAAYSGKEILWEDAMKNERQMAPIISSFNDEPPVKPGPDGVYPRPIPGTTEPV